MIIKRDGVYLFSGSPSSHQAAILKESGFRMVRNVWTTTDPCAVTRSAKVMALCSTELMKEVCFLRDKMASMLELSRSAKRMDVGVSFINGKELMDFQTAGVYYMLRAGRAINACPMGLGKTPMGIACIKYLFDKGLSKSALIVTPASLKYNWQNEIADWTGLHAEVIHSKWTPVPCNLAIINYDILGKFDAWIGAHTWDILIADEAHFLKSGVARRTQNFMKIQSKFFYALTGTPMPNNPSELFTLLHKARPDVFPDRWRFANEYCYIITEFGHRKIVGGRNLEKLSNKMRATCMFRVKKEEVLKDLPAKRRQIVVVENTFEKQSREEISAYEEMIRLKQERKEMKERCDATHDTEEHRDAMEAFASKCKEYDVAYGKLSTARKELAVSKVPVCLEHIGLALDSEEKLVVFVYHKEAGYMIEKSLNEAGIKTVFMCGDTPSEERQRMRDGFQEGDTRVIIGSFGAMGTGWTLTAACVTVFTELDWVPATLDQSEDRTHRIGQVNPVLIQYLVLKDSLDSMMIRKLVVKGRLIDKVMNT